jgi:hypothetical protein
MTNQMNESLNTGRTVVNILWTGGWDSTFRIIQLSFKNVIIQPFYLKDNRKSEQFELQAIKSITKELRELPSTKSIINEVKTTNVVDIEEDIEITGAYQQLYQKSFFGSQYDWLARFAKTLNNLELTIHQDDKAFSLIQNYGKVNKIYNQERGEYYKIDPSSSSKELLKVFGNFDFPILEYSKMDMKKEAEKNGFIHLLNKTWFCHTPFNGQPCGICNPCIYTIEEGLVYRFDKSAIKRYKRNKLISPVKKSFLFKGILRLWKFVNTKKR